MKQFIKIRYYSKNASTFDSILHSKHPFVILNTNEILSLDERRIWSDDTRYQKYPFRKLWIKNGDVYYLSVSEGDRIEKMLLDEEPHEEEKPLYVINGDKK